MTVSKHVTSADGKCSTILPCLGITRVAGGLAGAPPFRASVAGCAVS